MRAPEITPCSCPKVDHTFFGVPVASEVWHDLMDVVDDDGRTVGTVSIDPTEGPTRALHIYGLADNETCPACTEALARTLLDPPEPTEG